MKRLVLGLGLEIKFCLRHWIECVKTHNGSRQRLRSATRGDLVISPTVTHFGARSFAVAGPGISFRQTFVRLTQSTPLNAL